MPCYLHSVLDSPCIRLCVYYNCSQAAASKVTWTQLTTKYHTYDLGLQKLKQKSFGNGWDSPSTTMSLFSIAKCIPWRRAWHCGSFFPLSRGIFSHFLSDPVIRGSFVFPTAQVMSLTVRSTALSLLCCHQDLHRPLASHYMEVGWGGSTLRPTIF